MNRLYRAAAPLALASTAALITSAAPAGVPEDPLRFWEGRTESVGTMKLIMRKAYRTRSFGRGEIRPDGSLLLVQRVHEEGKPPHDRRWHIRKAGPNRYTGTMNEATSPVTIEEVGGKFRFRFRMKGNLSVEQWLTPRPDGRSAENRVTIRKMGVRVGHSEGVVRKVD